MRRDIVRLSEMKTREEEEEGEAGGTGGRGRRDGLGWHCYIVKLAPRF